VTDVLVYADSMRSPELRHEVPLAVPDPFLYVEHDRERHAVLVSFEIDRVEALGIDVETHPLEEFGYDELLAQGMSRDQAEREIALRACQRFGMASADRLPALFRCRGPAGPRLLRGAPAREE
jgi:Xaa-Pro aminopeptidase